MFRWTILSLLLLCDWQSTLIRLNDSEAIAEVAGERREKRKKTKRYRDENLTGQKKENKTDTHTHTKQNYYSNFLIQHHHNVCPSNVATLDPLLITRIKVKRKEKFNSFN